MDKKMRFRAVLFDLDGTLLDTIEDLTDSVNAALSSMGYPVHDQAAYKLMIGEGVRHLASSALPDRLRGDDSVVDECLRRTRDEYSRRWNVRTRPYDGIPELLDALVERGMRMAVLSNKPHEFTSMGVREILSKWRFDDVVGQRDGTPQKPDPASALNIARHLNVAPGEFVYLGDSGVDMRTAVAAGMYPVGVLWGFRDERELREGGALNTIAAPCELLSLL